MADFQGHELAPWATPAATAAVFTGMIAILTYHFYFSSLHQQIRSESANFTQAYETTEAHNASSNNNEKLEQLFSSLGVQPMSQEGVCRAPFMSTLIVRQTTTSLAQRPEAHLITQHGSAAPMPTIAYDAKVTSDDTKFVTLPVEQLNLLLQLMREADSHATHPQPANKSRDLPSKLVLGIHYTAVCTCILATIIYIAATHLAWIVNVGRRMSDWFAHTPGKSLEGTAPIHQHLATADHNSTSLEKKMQWFMRDAQAHYRSNRKAYSEAQARLQFIIDGQAYQERQLSELATAQDNGMDSVASITESLNSKIDGLDNHFGAMQQDIKELKISQESGMNSVANIVEASNATLNELVSLVEGIQNDVKVSNERHTSVQETISKLSAMLALLPAKMDGTVNSTMNAATPGRSVKSSDDPKPSSVLSTRPTAVFTGFSTPKPTRQATISSSDLKTGSNASPSDSRPALAKAFNFNFASTQASNASTETRPFLFSGLTKPPATQSQPQSEALGMISNKSAHALPASKTFNITADATNTLQSAQSTPTPVSKSSLHPLKASAPLFAGLHTPPHTPSQPPVAAPSQVTPVQPTFQVPSAADFNFTATSYTADYPGAPRSATSYRHKYEAGQEEKTSVFESGV